MASLTGWAESEMMEMDLKRLGIYYEAAVEHHNEMNAVDEESSTETK